VGCPLAPLSTGFIRPQLASGGYRVALVGEAGGADEAEEGAPFVGRAGGRLTRLIELAGLDRSLFDIWNVTWCRPPDNKLEGQPYEGGAINHCRKQHWDRLIDRVSVIVPMGNVPLAAFTGRKGILSTRGYVRPGPGTTHLVPTVHPSFIERGMSKWSSAFINDIQKAVLIAREGLPIELTNYVLDPLPGEAYEWAKRYRASLNNDPTIRLAYDIETPGKGEDEEALSDDDDPTFTIWRIGFSFEPFGALSVPWRPEYMAAIRLLLEGDGEKVVWNAGFDNPRIVSNGVAINGLVHDGMVAWHILQSDLPKKLGFVATFATPFQPEWKHLSHSRPAFYNATDADVELRSFLHIERELKRVGLWKVYQDDVLDLDPILRHMSRVGVLIDQDVRFEKAVQLAAKQTEVLAGLEARVPLSARRWDPPQGFVRAPAETEGLISIEVEASVKRCDRCGLINPTKPHFKTLKRPTAKKPQNPCAGACPVVRQEKVIRFARLVPFKPSREQLIRYQLALGRPVPTTKDKKTGERRATMNEKAVKEMIRKFGEVDPLYAGVLEYRELDKLGGTYIGRPA